VDIGYAQFMSVHHDQAVTMCQIVLARGTSAVGELASEILTAQLLEMGQLRGWLQAWKQPLLPTSRQMTWLLNGKTTPDPELLRYIADCDASPAGMTGLATSDELNQLRERDGQARDRLFLELMIRHHSAALPMARFAARNADTSLIKSAAQLDLVEQSAELNGMQLQLRREFGAAEPARAIN
jgi:uncharacterized protein (DUF305 family)